MKLSIIIPCYNAEATLRETLDALAAQTVDHPCEIVFVNNGSTDSSVEIAQSYAHRFPVFRILHSNGRTRAHACNVGAAAARGAFLAWVETDDVVGAGWANAMIAAIEAHGFVASRVDLERLNEAWAIAVRGQIQARHLDRLSYVKTTLPPFALGATLGIRKAWHDAACGFDEDVGGAEDIDYCWRVQQIVGKPLVFAPDVVLHYRLRHDMAGIYRQARSYARSNVYLYHKWRGRGLSDVRYALLGAGIAWARALAVLPLAAFGKRWRGKVMWVWGWQIGLLEGSRAHKTFLLGTPPARLIERLQKVENHGQRTLFRV